MLNAIRSASVRSDVCVRPARYCAICTLNSTSRTVNSASKYANGSPRVGVDERRAEVCHRVEALLGDGDEVGLAAVVGREVAAIDADARPPRRHAAGSAHSRPALDVRRPAPNGVCIAPSMIATSVTVRHIGPAVSWLWAIGMIPSCDESPSVGLSPTTRLLPAGQTIEPSVSVPTAAAHRFAAGATAEPELDPHGSKLRRYGSRVKPPRALQPLNGAKPPEVRPLGEIGLAEDHRAAPRAAALTIGASAGTRLFTSASDPAVVSIRSSVAMLSFTITGMPCSGPRTRPLRRSLSSRAAIATAFGLDSIPHLAAGSGPRSVADSRASTRGWSTVRTPSESGVGELSLQPTAAQPWVACPRRVPAPGTAM